METKKPALGGPFLSFGGSVEAAKLGAAKSAGIRRDLALRIVRQCREAEGDLLELANPDGDRAGLDPLVLSKTDAVRHALTSAFRLVPVGAGDVPAGISACGVLAGLGEGRERGKKQDQKQFFHCVPPKWSNRPTNAHRPSR